MSIENENKKPSFDVLVRLVRELGISADTIFYPENQHIDTKVEQLVRLLYLCNERELKIVTATIKALLDNKKQYDYLRQPVDGINSHTLST